MVARGHQDARRFAGFGAVFAFAGVGGACPIAIIAVIHNALLAARSEIIVPGLKAIVSFAQDGQIAGMHIGFPARHQERGTHRIRRAAAKGKWRGAADGAAFILHIEQVAHDLGEQATDIEVIGRFFKAHGGVVHPAHALIALRAIGEDAVDVGALGLHHHLLDGVHDGAAAAEAAVAVHIAV